MKVFYLNCHRLLKHNKNGQRDWLVKTVLEHNVDVVCLSESSNYDFAEAMPNPGIFPKKYRWIAPPSTLSKMGYKLNLCSKLPVTYESIDYTVSPGLYGDKDAETAADYSTGTMISMKFDDLGYEIIPVHLQHKQSRSQTLSPKNAYYELGLQKLREYMLEHKPIAVFGDFNNYPDDKSFLALTDDTGYQRIASDDVSFTYKNNPKDDFGLVIDHTFTNHKNVYMEYILSMEHGFDHHGMLITIDNPQ